ncbi:hypothetical protein [Streptomyces sp. NPDC055287]
MDESLSFESFFQGAKKAAHRAMADHGRGEYDEFALHAGVAVEKLAKAVLVSKNPMYIVEMRGSAEMLFHLGGHRAAGKVRTIGAAEAIARVRMLDVLTPDRQLDLLIDLRNGVAHSASGHQAKALLPTLAQAAETLLTDLGGPLNAFWERWTTAARLALDDKRSEIYRDVQVRIRQAKHVFEDRFAGLPGRLMERAQGDGAKYFEYALMRMEGPGRVRTNVFTRESCPACACTAYLSSEIQRTGERAQFTAVAMNCSMCHLVLEGPAELLAGGLNAQAVNARVSAWAASYLGGKHGRPLLDIPEEDLFRRVEDDND